MHDKSIRETLVALGFWTYVVLDWHSVCAALGMVAEDGRTLTGVGGPACHTGQN